MDQSDIAHEKKSIRQKSMTMNCPKLNCNPMKKSILLHGQEEGYPITME